MSVIVPAYNRVRFVGLAVHSALRQTLRDLEVIVIDDGSQDDTAGVVASIRDPRVRLFRNDKNLGIAATQNFALTQARSEYVAFLDSDDLMERRRLERQIAFLDARPDVSIVGGWYQPMNEEGKPTSKPVRLPTAPDEVFARMLFRVEIWKGTATGRLMAWRAFGFDTTFTIADDYDLWIRMLRQGSKLANLPMVTGFYRIHSHQTTVTSREATAADIAHGVTTQLGWLGIAAQPDDLNRHLRLGYMWGAPKRKYLGWAREWLQCLLAANRSAGVYPQRALTRAAQEVWRRACWASLRRTGAYGLYQLLHAKLD